MPTIPERFIRPLVLAAIVLIAVLALIVPRCTSRHTQDRVNRGQTEAGADTGEISLNTLETVTANAAETDRTVSEGSVAIHAAPEADKGRVAVQQACRLKANRNKPQCQGAAR